MNWFPLVSLLAFIGSFFGFFLVGEEMNRRRAARNGWSYDAVREEMKRRPVARNGWNYDLVGEADGLIDVGALRSAQSAQTLSEALDAYAEALRDLRVAHSGSQVVVDEHGDSWLVSADPAVVRLDAILADLARLGAAFPDPPICRVCGYTDSRACQVVEEEK